MALSAFLFVVLSACFIVEGTAKSDEKELDDPHRDPSLCEVCKYLTTELKERLDETGKTNEVIETGYSLDKEKRKKKYKNSELRLIEAVEDPHVCDKIMEYQVHAERKGSLRFAKGRSETMQTLHNLVDKGVNVELGIPYELWDTPSAGVAEMQRQCFKIVEDHEEDIQEWYYNKQDEDLTNYLCRDRVLKSGDKECLGEVWTGKKDKDKKAEKKGESSEKPPKKSKKGTQKSDKLKGETGEPTEESTQTSDSKEEL